MLLTLYLLDELHYSDIDTQVKRNEIAKKP